MRAAVQQVHVAAMDDLVEVLRPTSGYTIDPVTKVAVPTPPEVIYRGEGRLQPAVALNERRIQIGGDVRTTDRCIGALPADAPEVIVDDIFVAVESHDPQLAGRPMVVRNVWFDTYLSRRVLICEADPEAPS